MRKQDGPPGRGGDRRRIRRALRVAGWNAVLTAAGLALIAAAGELWLRSTVPFMTSSIPRAFVPGVGLIGKPGAEVRHTNRLDYWQVSRFNAQGFLDREPPRAGPAADACHITVIGDSFVEARHVPVADKLHVRLEVLAARRTGRRHVTTSAFGRDGTGQIAQLAYYDRFARKRRPRLVVLVFVGNDYVDNSPLLVALRTRHYPDRLAMMTAERGADGALRLRPPNPDYEIRPHPPRRAARLSYFWMWLNFKRGRTLGVARPPLPGLFPWAEVLRQQYPDEPLFDAVARREWSGQPGLDRVFAGEQLLPPYAAELEYTAFALDQFRHRADRDGAALVILTNHDLRPGEPLFDRVRAIAGELRIPVVSLYDHIVRRGGRVRDAHWRHDGHWNPAGHQWAAEAILEHLLRRPDVCARGPRRTPAPGAAGDIARNEVGPSPLRPAPVASDGR